MKWTRLLPVVVLLVILVCAGCSPAAEPEAPPPEAADAAQAEVEEVPPTATMLPPTETPVPDTPTPEPTATETPLPTQASYEGPARIVFSSNHEDPDILDLYLLDPFTLEITQVGTGLDIALGADWAPDGVRIAFTVSNPWSIYTINSDGSDLIQVTDYSSAFPSWSPDGLRLVHQSDHQNEPKDTPDLYIVDANGSNKVEVLDDPDIPDYQADWSPDGEKILFVSRRDSNALYTINIDGSEMTKLFDPPEPLVTGVWSPDGSKVAFIAGRGGKNKLFIANTDGSELTLLDDSGPCNNPAWSPDGMKIVFSSNRSGNYDLWMINTDGTELVQLTNDVYYDDYPDWSVGTME